MQTDLNVEILMIFIKTLYSTKKCVGGQMDRIINRLMDRQTDRCMDRLTDRGTEQWTDEGNEELTDGQTNGQQSTELKG